MNKKIKEIIDNFEIVSFDVYDTLINRDVNHYSVVFDLLEEKAKLIIGKEAEGLAAKRIEAEKKARKASQFEICLDDIYKQIDIKNKKKIKELEIEIEISIAQRNNENYELFLYCKNAHKKLIVISDMYLDQNVIQSILYKNGYSSFEKIYVSSNCGYTKRKGRLFDYVIKDLAIKKKDIIHLGDNVLSDYIIPRAMGIHAIQIRPQSRTTYIDKKNGLFSFVNNRIKNIVDDYTRIGYEVYGPLIFGFLKWLHEETEKRGIHKVFFASRDGYILQKAYKILYPDIYNRYFKVSRRSVQVPIIGKTSSPFEAFIKFASFDPITDNNTIYKRIGVEISAPAKTVLQNEIALFFEKDPYINEKKDEIIAEANSERKALASYLKSIHFDGDVAFVDVGWKCSTQKVLELLGNANIEGFYFGVHPSVDHSIKANGYLFNREKSENFYSIMGGMALLEAILTSPEPSLKKYSIDKDGNTVFDYGKGVKLKEKSLVFSIHEGIIQFIRDISLSDLRYLQDDCFNSFEVIKKIICFPTDNEITRFGNIDMENEEKIRPILGQMKNASIITEYSRSGWKIGFLKKLLKLPFPYYKLFKLSYVLYKR